jgi:subtilase family serine protease
MLLLLEPPAAKRQALDAELVNQQKPGSPAFHRWLTPTAFAAAYGNSAADVATLSSWLSSQGFQVAPLPAGRGWIEFSGTVSQVELAFHTRVKAVSTPAGMRPVLSAMITVPAALQPLVHGLVSLDGAISTPALTRTQPVTSTVVELAAQTSLSQAEAVTPQLMAGLLHLDALKAAGTTGAGETIAIATRSSVRSQDVAAFRSAFGLQASPVSVVPDGPDPGVTADAATATMAASWAGAAAPGAQVLLVPAATTAATDGLDLSLAAIVDQALAHTVVVGYSTCEAVLSETHQAFYAALYRQAAAEGIAVIAAAGDSGPAACHAAGSDAPVSSGYAVNALASTPWNTAVGVAAFGPASPSALAAWSPVNMADPAYAGGGGSSTLYSAPAWQPAIAATPSASEASSRSLPDVALPTALDSVLNHGLAFCLSGPTAETGCTVVRAGGSSAATAIFSGIGALVAGKYGPQGNLAPNLYALSKYDGIFDDVQQGSAQLPCVSGTSGCGATGQIGFTAAAGYDLATGLGSVDAQTLVTEWARPFQIGTGLVTVNNTITPSQTINPSGSVVLSANVTAQGVGPAPTGDVAFYDESNSSVVAVVALTPGSGTLSSASTTATGVLSVGGHPIQAQYSGDENYAAASDPIPIVIEVEPSPTTTVVTPATNSPTPGGTVSVSATISSLTAGTGALSPTGTVDFRMDGVSQGTQPVTAGTPVGAGTLSTASATMTVPYTAGNHNIVGFYSGDSNYNNSTSQAAVINVPPSAPTVIITPANASPVAGSTLLINATIAAPSGSTVSPTGTMTFSLDGTAVGTEAVKPGTPSTSSITIAVPSVGSHNLQGTYNGDTNYTATPSAVVTINVGTSPTSLALNASTLSPVGGSSMTLIATLTPQYPGAVLPTGTVAFSMDGVAQGGPVSISGLTASTTITAPAYGVHTLTAAYSGDTYFSASTSTTLTFTVAKTATTLVLTPATTTPAAGSPLIVTATVSTSNPGVSQPSGTVTFTLSGLSEGTAAVVQGTPSTAAITIPSLNPGVYLLTGSYSGDSYYAASTTVQAITITVPKAPTTTVVTPATVTPVVGGSILVTATVNSTNYGTAQPSGTVSFLLDGTTTVGSGTVVAGYPSTATVTLTGLTAGMHVLTATYSGDTYYATSTSAGVYLTVARGATTTTLAVTGTPAVGMLTTSWTLTATVTPTASTPLLGGSVSFYDTVAGSTTATLLGSASVSSSTTAAYTATLVHALANNTNHSLTAIYTGDANWLPSSTATPFLLVASTIADSIVLTTNLATSPTTGLPTSSPGQAIILVATVTPLTAPAVGTEQNPTGTVTFYISNGTTATIVGTAQLVAQTPGDTSAASLTLTSLPGGQETVYAVYVGDLYFNSGTSNSILIDILDFSIAPDPSTPAPGITIVKGSSGTATFDITGLGGFTDQVQVVCQVPSQDYMTCTPTPQQVTPPGTVTFLVTTFTSGSATTASRKPEPLWPRAAGGTALAALAFFLLPFGRRVRIFAGRRGRRFLTLLLLLVGLGGAGLGCSSVTLVTGNTGGTALGQTNLTIVATDNINNTVISHTAYLTVNVVAAP